MNINCIICGDLFAPNSEIYVTKCGHIFHHACLIQWLERSRSCPQCRAKTTERNIYRIYFNIVSNEGIEEDAVSLQNKVDSLDLALRLKEKLVKTTATELEKVIEEKKIIENILKDVKVNFEKFKSGNALLKEQIKIYQEQIKVTESIQKENKQLKEQIRAHQIETTVVKGTCEQTSNIVNNSENIDTLKMISNSLKKELVNMEQKRNYTSNKLHKTENELHVMKKDYEQLKKQNDQLQYELRAHKQCEKEMQTLRSEISKLIENTDKPIDPSLMRVVSESPAPRLTRLKENLFDACDLSFEKIDSPSVSKRVEQIKDSNSPYLTVQTGSLPTFLKSTDMSLKFKNSTSSSIFKKFTASATPTLPQKPVPEGYYNGLGGHAKEDRYPTPKLTGLKRSKSASMASKKFKKNDKPNKKLDDFLNLSNL